MDVSLLRDHSEVVLGDMPSDSQASEPENTSTIGQWVRQGFQLGVGAISYLSADRWLIQPALKAIQAMGILASIDSEAANKELVESTVSSANDLFASFTKVAVVGVIGPFIEEMIFREGVQYGLFQALPLLLTSTENDKSAMTQRLNAMAWKTIRIVTTATLFTAVHLFNVSEMSDSNLALQLSNAFIGGLALSILRETPLGLLGSIGAHIANNSGAVFTMLGSS